MRNKQPYNNSVSDFFIFAVIIALLLALSACCIARKPYRRPDHIDLCKSTNYDTRTIFEEITLI